MHELARAGLGPRPFARWADAGDNVALPDSALTWLGARLGELQPRVTEQIAAPVPRSELPAPARRELAALVGPDHVDDSADARRAHAGGQSLRDLVRRRAEAGVLLPDAVIRPANHEEVAATLAVCHDHRVAVIPYGGGTSVVGGVEPTRGRHYAVVTVDTSRMDRLLGVDPVAGTATFQPGVTGPRAEELLAPHGLTIGHVPQSFARASLGGYAATRSAGQASVGYGRLDDLVVAVRVATPTGSGRFGTGTPNAAGPDLRALFVGSEGALGILTEITLRVRPAPTARRYQVWAMPSFDDGVDCVRALVQEGVAPDVVRLSDEAETEVTRALHDSHRRRLNMWLRLRGLRRPAFCVVGWEGTPRSVRDRRRASVRVLRRHRGVPLGDGAGESWRRHRFDGPFQREALLDAGVLVETVETAASWSKLPEVYAAVWHALDQALTVEQIRPVVMTHVSHAYPTGASLYVTVLARQADTADEVLRQWAEAKAAASEAIVRCGATISHHHAVGRDHTAYLDAEIGTLGLSALGAVKAALDPRGILNPGALLPPTDGRTPGDRR